MPHDVDSDLPVAVYAITLILLLATSAFSWAFLVGSQKCDDWGSKYGGASEGCKIASGMAGGSQIALICLGIMCPVLLGVFITLWSKRKGDALNPREVVGGLIWCVLATVLCITSAALSWNLYSHCGGLTTDKEQYINSETGQGAGIGFAIGAVVGFFVGWGAVGKFNTKNKQGFIAGGILSVVLGLIACGAGAFISVIKSIDESVDADDWKGGTKPGWVWDMTQIALWVFGMLGIAAIGMGSYDVYKKGPPGNRPEIHHTRYGNFEMPYQLSKINLTSQFR